MIEALAFALVALALGLPALAAAVFGSDIRSDLPADRHTSTTMGPKPKQLAKSAFEVMSPPLWHMRLDSCRRRDGSGALAPARRVTRGSAARRESSRRGPR